MADLLNSLEIKNFKSIKLLETDCKRVNVFIGKPNVGKSNILEAISLLGAQYSNNEDKFLSEFIRYQDISNLFYDDDLANIVEVHTDKVSAALRFHNNAIDMADLVVAHKNLVMDTLRHNRNTISDIKSRFTGMVNQEISTFAKLSPNKKMYFVKPFYTSIHSNGKAPSLSQDSDITISDPIKKYTFSDRKIFSNKYPFYLLPPDGPNLFAIVDQDKELRSEVAEIFEEYGLQFVSYKKEHKFEIEKKIDGYVYKYPYSSMADTFQRLIFYFAAIDSNKESVLILEEPEVHSFPPYTKELSQRIVDSKENQFFITTHSPYLLQNLISELDSIELNLFITYFEDYQTKIRKLTSEELRMASQFSVDLFYNLNQFVENA